MFDDPQIQLEKIFEVRWLSFHSAVDSRYPEQWFQLWLRWKQMLLKEIHQLQRYSRLCDRTTSFISQTYFDSDVLGIISKLSKLFQRDVLDFSIIQPTISNSIEALLQLKDHDWVHLTMHL